MQEFITTVHICCYFEICEDTWYDALKTCKNDKTTVAAKKIKSMQQKWWISTGLGGKVPPTSWKFCMQNIHGWREKSSVESNNTNTVSMVAASILDDDLDE